MTTYIVHIYTVYYITINKRNLDRFVWVHFPP